MTSEGKPAGWSAIRRHLNEESKLALLALVSRRPVVSMGGQRIPTDQEIVDVMLIEGT